MIDCYKIRKEDKMKKKHMNYFKNRSNNIGLLKIDLVLIVKLRGEIYLHKKEKSYIRNLYILKIKGSKESKN